MRKGEEVRNREEISKMGARKQELEVEEIISWPSRAPGENDERMGEGRAQSEAQSEEVTLLPTTLFLSPFAVLGAELSRSPSFFSIKL